MSNTIRLPKAEEVEKIKTSVKEVFSFVSIEHGEIRTMPDGRMLVRTTIPQSLMELVICRLFGYGIVIVNAGNGEWGFAVRS